MATIRVYQHLSPRIVEVLDPAEEITIQQIVDLIREWEDEEANMVYSTLIDAAGKEPLGGSVFVGITATLQNAQLRFSSRPNELETGTVTTGDAGGITLHDTSGLFETNNVYPGCTVQNNTTTAMETVTEVTSEIELQHFALGGGTGRNDWQIGDTYSIYPNVQCKITGGNLVAVNDIGGEISPILQSPNVQIVRSSSSSATLQELDAVQYASFNGGVTVDLLGSYSGTAFPSGTPQQPVNNFADAMLIAIERGFGTLYILGDATIDSSGDYSGMIFVGESMTKSSLSISTGANVENCEFYEATIGGTLDGNAKLKNCRILDLNYIYGVVEQCMIGPGTIVLGGADEAHFLDCWSGVAGASTPLIDCGGSGQALALRNYNGGIKLINKTGTDKISIDLNSGHIILDSTIEVSADDEIVLRGVGHLTNESTSTGGTVNSSDLLNAEAIARANWATICIDTVNGIDSDVWPAGLPNTPCKTEANALAISAREGLKRYCFAGTLVLTQDHDGFNISGHGDITTDTIVLSNISIDGSYFYKCGVTGTMTASDPTFESCMLIDLVGARGLVRDCGFFGSLTMGDPGSMMFGNNGSAASFPFTIDMVGAGRMFMVDGIGDYLFKNMAYGAPYPSNVSLGSFNRITFDSTCVGGVASLFGTGQVVDNSSGAVAITDITLAGLHGYESWEGMDESATASAVWDAVRATYNTSGTFGATDEWSGSIDSDDVASAVWNAIQDDYGIPGTMGWLQNLIESGIIGAPRIIPGD